MFKIGGGTECFVRISCDNRSKNVICTIMGQLGLAGTWDIKESRCSICVDLPRPIVCLQTIEARGEANRAPAFDIFGADLA